MLLYVVAIIIFLNDHQTHSLLSTYPSPKTVFKSCFENNRLCFEADLSIQLSSCTFTRGLDQMCPPGKTLPQILSQVEQKAFQDYLVTLPKDTKYYSPIGLRIKYLTWTDVIKTKGSNISDKNYLMIRISKGAFQMQAVDSDARYPFVCLTTATCQVTKPTADVVCITIDGGCLYLVNTKTDYYSSVNYCKSHYNADLLSYSVLSSSPKLVSNLPANVQELWIEESRLVLSWINNVPAVYTNWSPGHPKDDSTFAYLRYDIKDGGWISFQDCDSSSHDNDINEKYIMVCVSDERPLGTPKPVLKANDDGLSMNKMLKIGLGIGFGLCFLVAVTLVTVVVVCLRCKKQRYQEGKIPPLGTIAASVSSGADARRGCFSPESGYNNYVSSTDFIGNSPCDTRNNPYDTRVRSIDNYGTGYERNNLAASQPGGVYEEIRPYELPNNAAFVEHIYNSIKHEQMSRGPQFRQFPQTTQLEGLSLFQQQYQGHHQQQQGQQQQQHGQQQQQQQHYIQMKRNSYLDVIA